MTLTAAQKEAHYAKIRNLVSKAGGRFISAEFFKKTGEFRKMQIQPAALKNRLADNPSPSALQAAETRARNNPNLLNVWSVDANGARSVNMDRLVALTIDGERHEFEPLEAGAMVFVPFTKPEKSPEQSHIDRVLRSRD